MPIKTTGLYHLHLLVSDVSRSVRFYSEVFDAKVLFDQGPDMVFLGIPGTETSLTLHTGTPSRGGVDHFLLGHG